MPVLTVTKSYDDGQTPTESMLDDIKSSVETFINITGIDSSNIQTGGIATANLATGLFTADAAGRAKMADGYLSADATGRAKVADSFFTTAKLNDGALSADATGRAKMADSFITTAKINDGAFSADATGRAKMADGFITSAKFSSTIDLPTSAQTGGRYNVVGNAGDTRNICIVSGWIEADGSTLAGTGFSAVKDSTGRYTVTFTTSFTAIYSAVVTWNGDFTLTLFPQITNLSNSAFSYGVRDNSSGVDTRVNFIVVGSR